MESGLPPGGAVSCYDFWWLIFCWHNSFVRYAGVKKTTFPNPIFHSLFHQSDHKAALLQNDARPNNEIQGNDEKNENIFDKQLSEK